MGVGGAGGEGGGSFVHFGHHPKSPIPQHFRCHVRGVDPSGSAWSLLAPNLSIYLLLRAAQAALRDRRLTSLDALPVWELEEHLEAFFSPLDAAAEADGFHGSASLLSSTVHQQMHRLQASRRVMSLTFKHVLESWQNLKAALPPKVFANSKWMATVLWILP